MFAKKFSVLLVASVFFLASAHAGKNVFADNFDSEHTDVDIESMTNWRVVNGGTVDVFHHGDHGGLPCASGAGICVDLNGSSGITADLVSLPISLKPGTYKLSYKLAGSQRGDTNSVKVLFNNVKTRKVTMTWSAPYKKFTDTIVVTEPISASIEFKTENDPDMFGLLLDDVKLQKQ